MNCINIDTRTRQIEREARIIRKRIGNGDTTNVLIMLEAIKLHVQAITAELASGSENPFQSLHDSDKAFAERNSGQREET